MSDKSKFEVHKSEDEWKKELKLIGKKVDLTFKGQKYKVQIKDILESGELLVAFDNGKEKKMQSLYTSLDYQSLLKYNKDNYRERC